MHLDPQTLAKALEFTEFVLGKAYKRCGLHLIHTLRCQVLAPESSLPTERRIWSISGSWKHDIPKVPNVFGELLQPTLITYNGLNPSPQILPDCPLSNDPARVAPLHTYRYIDRRFFTFRGNLFHYQQGMGVVIRKWEP